MDRFGSKETALALRTNSSRSGIRPPLVLVRFARSINGEALHVKKTLNIPIKGIN
jgi:hypothetical protein